MATILDLQAMESDTDLSFDDSSSGSDSGASLLACSGESSLSVLGC